MAIILKANKASLLVSSALFVFWYHSPNFLETPRISELNSILWDRDVTVNTETHIYHATVKSTITYAAETWCLKTKTLAKLNFSSVWSQYGSISRASSIR
jgi:hypothetical protein